MRKVTMQVALFAGALALVPAMAHAFSGLLVTCIPTTGVPVDATASPGLQCASTINKIGVEATFDGCTANGAAPWDDWATVKYPAKITSAAAATIAHTSLKLKAKTYGTCNFAGSGNSFTASGAAKFTFLNAAEDTKVGKGAAYATVGGDLPSQSAALKGLVTKGSLVGAQISIQIGIDLASPNNSGVLACNTGAACPPDITPAEILSLKTTATSFLKIGVAANGDCTAAGSPWACCTGAGAGNC